MHVTNMPGPKLHNERWIRLLALGGVVWAFSIVAFKVSHDRYVVPTTVVFGAFVVPIAWLVRTVDRERPSAATPLILAKAFVLGGALGFLSSALLETEFDSTQPALFSVGVGLVEEAFKLLAVIWIVRQVRVRSPQLGFVVGAAVGFGFEAFEDAGYALNALASSHSWSSMIRTELNRAVTTPVTHGLWAAVLGAALLHQSRNGRVRLTWPFAAWFGAVAGLHALWDLIPGVGVYIDKHVLGNAVPSYLVADVGLAILGLIGLALANHIRPSQPDRPVSPLMEEQPVGVT
jgi:RsiW-degrading membrane proteinase PrsW (M82 family)